MTDKEFINYLTKMLLNSGHDCCSICAYCPDNDVCDNAKENEKPNDEVCTAGVREYAQKKI